MDQQFSIFLGDQKTFPLRLAFPGGFPASLTNCTEIIIFLPLTAGGFQPLKYSLSQVQILSPTILGQFQAVITSAVSALLLVGLEQDVDVTFTIAGAPFTVRYSKILSVFE